MEQFDREKRKFVIDALNSAKILEDIAGISDLTCTVDEVSSLSTVLFKVTIIITLFQMIDFSGSDCD